MKIPQGKMQAEEFRAKMEAEEEKLRNRFL